MTKKICICVTGFSEDKKKRVQDAFFKLGFVWRGQTPTKYRFLDSSMYTSVCVNGGTTGYLMWCNRSSVTKDQQRHLVTYDKLMELAGMSKSTEPQKRYWDGKEELQVGMWCLHANSPVQLKIRSEISGWCVEFTDGSLTLCNTLTLQPIDTRTDKQKAIDEIFSLAGFNASPSNVLSVAYDKWVGKDE